MLFRSTAGRLVDPADDSVAIYFSPMELEKRLFGQSRKVVDGAAAALFEEARDLLPKGFARQPEMICSSKLAAVGILEAAAGWKAEMIVVGARGHGSVERLLLGNNLEQHARHLSLQDRETARLLLKNQQSALSQRLGQAVEAAYAAFKGWKRTPAPARGKILMKMVRLMEDHKEELSQLLSHEEGKTKIGRAHV